MIWDSTQQDWQIFWLSFEHWLYASTLAPAVSEHDQINLVLLDINTWQTSIMTFNAIEYKSIWFSIIDLVYWFGILSIRGDF